MNLSKLNGAFLILLINKKDNSFKFINDRFNGVHFLLGQF